MVENKQLLLAFYGDDFTGSTDALEVLTSAGASVMLFIEPPTVKQLAKYPDLDAYGVAGMTRSLNPADMEKVLLPAFTALKQSGARHVHYKVCSTFDSSPTVGSIGKAIDVGAAVFKNGLVPLLVAAPSLGRYCVFGNLFAKMGIGSNGSVFRLDRHPSMSKHPVTPMDESDLRLHLSKQTSKKIALLDILDIEKSQHELSMLLTELTAAKNEIVLIDALHQHHLFAIGKMLDRQVKPLLPLFSVGSSGIEMALSKYWAKKQLLPPTNQAKGPGKASPLLVISGSCSPITAAQVEWAKAKGFQEVVIDAIAIGKAKDVSVLLTAAIKDVVAVLQKGKSVIVHTEGAAKKQSQHVSSVKLGTALGMIARQAASATKLKRIVIAGGDTSSYAARAMGIEAVQMIAPLVAGAPLCRAFAEGSPIDGLEVNFKGGQVGDKNYFGILLEGKVDVPV